MSTDFGKEKFPAQGRKSETRKLKTLLSVLRVLRKKLKQFIFLRTETLAETGEFGDTGKQFSPVFPV